jgi:cell division protein FtsW (lipid II flippase)
VERRPSWSPVVATLAGGIVAVAIGMAAMALGGAPRAYLAVNGGALVAGLVIASALTFVPLGWRWPSLAAALALLATAVWGIEMDGIHRWVMVGPLTIQPAVILLPALACSYARCPDSPLLGASMVIAAVAVALQPDWSMAMALAVISCNMLTALRNRLTIAVAAAALIAFAAALFRGGYLPPVRFVEEVIVDGLLRGGPVIGGLIVVGISALLAPVLLAARMALVQQRALAVFVQLWLMLLIASGIGPYPTPLLGYGASAIIGYFIAIVMLRPSARSQAGELH